jgi:hypothetical protein
MCFPNNSAIFTQALDALINNNSFMMFVYAILSIIAVIIFTAAVSKIINLTFFNKRSEEFARVDATGDASDDDVEILRDCKDDSALNIPTMFPNPDPEHVKENIHNSFDELLLHDSVFNVDTNLELPQNILGITHDNSFDEHLFYEYFHSEGYAGDLAYVNEFATGLYINEEHGGGLINDADEMAEVELDEIGVVENLGLQRTQSCFF